MAKSVQRTSGFTLIEVVLALMILAGSLVTLIGLESAGLKRSLDDSQKLRANMYLRSILTDLESAEEDIEDQHKQTTVGDMVDSVVSEFNPDINKDANMKVRIDVAPWQVPQTNIKLRKLTVVIQYGFSDSDVLSVAYFLPDFNAQ